MKKIKQYKYIILVALIFLGLGMYYFQTMPSEKTASSEKINPIYFYSSAYEDKNGSYAIQCPQTKGIDWQLAIYTLSAYMQFETHGEEIGPAEIQRNFDENCERNMKIYTDVITRNPELLQRNK
ncbi:MAG: hypothetical protein NTV60_01380 [Candidatus Kaiserbacteria bacterium]|nr:hypothetical protein [Candidatus Kaiserbacteria bacterium]